MPLILRAGLIFIQRHINARTSFPRSGPLALTVVSSSFNIRKRMNRVTNLSVLYPPWSYFKLHQYLIFAVLDTQLARMLHRRSSGSLWRFPESSQGPRFVALERDHA